MNDVIEAPDASTRRTLVPQTELTDEELAAYGRIANTAKGEAVT